MDEPNLVRKKGFTENVIKKQKMILIVAVIGIITLFAGSSYSLLTNFDAKTANKVLTFQNSGLEMTVNKSGVIDLTKMGPQTDEVGLSTAIPVVLTFTNTGQVNIAKYDVKLKAKQETLNDKYIKYSISTDYGVSYSKAKVLADSNDIIYSDFNLDVNKSKIIYLKLFVASNAPNLTITKNALDIDVTLQVTASVPYATSQIKKTLSNDYGVIGINREGQVASQDEMIREYRYSGTHVNNYVKFNNELWRIIGIFQENNEEYLKIVRDNNLESFKIPEVFVFNGITYEMRTNNNENGNLYWNKSEALKEDMINNWSTSGINNYLNNSQDTSKHSGYLSYLSNNAKKMLRDTIYYCGNISNSTNLQAIYKDEKVESWKGKVSLVSLSDFLYTFDKSNYNNKQLQDYKTNSWFLDSLKNAQNETSWLLNGSLNDALYNINENLELESLLPNNALSGIRVVVSLNPNVVIQEGIGTKDNPYILSI